MHLRLKGRAVWLMFVNQQGIEAWKTNKREQPTDENTDEKGNTIVMCVTRHSRFVGYVVAVLKSAQIAWRKTCGA